MRSFPKSLGKQKLLLLSLLVLGLAGLVPALLLLLQPRTLPSPTTPSEMKIFVEEDGIYALSYADLEEAGLDLDEVDPGMIQLSNQGREVPIVVSGQARDLAIIFYGVANTSPYSRRNVYWLSPAGDPGERMVQRAGSSAAHGAPAGSFRDTIRREEDPFYAPKVPPRASHWYWQSLFAPGSSTFATTLPHLVPGDGTFRLALLGYTSDSVNPDHHLRIRFNDCSTEEVWWDGQTGHVMEAPLPYPCLREGENLLTVEAVGDTGALADIVLVDWLEIDYQRSFTVTDDELEFTGQSGAHTLSGFSNEDVWLFDISDPLDVALITRPTVEKDESGYTLSFFEGEPAGHRYLAVSQAGLKQPAGIMAPSQGADLRSKDNEADYVVITHEAFRQAIQPLVEWRSSQGLRVKVVTITEVCDQFSYGLTDPAAIREFLRYAHQHWTRPAPQYVLLVGDASYDYRDNLQGPNSSLVPSYMVESTFGGQTTSDNWFVSLDDDDILPDMAIGRLPVKTVEEVSRLVNKIIAYEGNAPPGRWRDRILLVADDGGTFARQSDALADQWLPSIYEPLKIYAASAEDPQSLLLRELGQGSLIVNYVGHGSIDLWSDESLFSSEQVVSLDNGGRQPLMIMMSCLLGFFAHPELDSMAEELLLAENRGAIAVFAPSSLTLPSDQEPLNQALFNALLSGETPDVGIAIMEAKRSLELETADQRDVIETFTLLGDPALRLARPD